MITPAPDFRQPTDKNIKTWRYMDFTKFVWMLTTNTLYFPRADQLGDPFEGSWPKLNVEQRSDMLKEMAAPKPSDVSETMADFAKRLRQYVYVNCWHANEHESAAMWKLYAESGKGIAIQTTFDRLYDILDAVPTKLFLGMIEYLDYQNESTPWVGALSPFMRKRKSFEHEQEVRAIIEDAPDSWPLSREQAQDEGRLEGLTVAVNLDDLIEKVYVAPQSSDWFLKLVRSVCRKYDLSKIPQRSNLDEDPLF